LSNATGDITRKGHLALVVGHPASTGGMEMFCRFLARTALVSGWRVTVALSGENVYEPLQEEFPRQLTVDRVRWIDRTCAGDRDYSLSRICSRGKWFRKTRPGVAVIVQSSNTPFRCAVLGARLAGVPTIVTHRTMPWPVETVPSRRHLFGLLPGIGLHGRLLVAKTLLTAFAANRVVFNSAAVRRGYETIYHYPPRRNVIIPNAVQLPAVTSDSIDDRNALPVRIGFIGRIGADKRLDVLLRAVAGMRTTPAPRVILHGEGADQPALADLAVTLGIADRVEWRGLTQDLASAHADMDIIALCSPRESSSNMVLEAMAAGKPVVVTDAGGMPGLVGHGRCGLCVPALDVPALTIALERLTRDPELRRQLGRQGRDKAMVEHDPQTIGRQWMTLLAQVAERRRTPQPLQSAAPMSKAYCTG
jgi:glycosyltransferase involved in cell wall biosynthesis